MTPRTAALLAASATALLAGLPAWAQAPDFGDDSSVWANDGECDDPRFTGPGVSSTTVEVDRMRDASDCRAAFEAGSAQLIEAQGTPPSTEAPQPSGGKGAQNAQPPATPQTPSAPEAAPVAIDFGDDSSEWANDGECDDRRFVGQGMAASFSWANLGRDATDCRMLYDSGSVRLWNMAEAQAATQCTAIDFGDDSGDYANDTECDDIRFEGLGMASGLSETNIRRDATDCRQLCAFGVIGLRDY